MSNVSRRYACVPMFALSMVLLHQNYRKNKTTEAENSHTKRGDTTARESVNMFAANKNCLPVCAHTKSADVFSSSFVCLSAAIHSLVFVVASIWKSHLY